MSTPTMQDVADLESRVEELEAEFGLIDDDARESRMGNPDTHAFGRANQFPAELIGRFDSAHLYRDDDGDIWITTNDLLGGRDEGICVEGSDALHDLADLIAEVEQ